jgi:hypothetical protein
MAINTLPRKVLPDTKMYELINNISDYNTRRAVEELIARQFLLDYSHLADGHDEGSVPDHTHSDTDIIIARWDDIRVGAGTVRTQGVANLPTYTKVNDNGSGSAGVYSWAFDDTTLQQVFFEAQIPHKWERGTDLEFHVHWTTLTGNAGAVVWGLEYQVLGYTVTPATNTTIVTTAGTAIETALAENLTDIATIDMSGDYMESAVILGRFFRDAAAAEDTLVGDAIFLSCDFHYQIDKIGTLTEYPS